MAYLDDIIIIFSKDEKEHLKHIVIIFQKLLAAVLKFQKRNPLLGPLIWDKGIHPLPEMLDSICNKPKPKNPKEIKKFQNSNLHI